jgi:hypothetical protein
VNIIDQFGTNTLTVSQLHHICTPTNKNGEDPNAPTDPNHLTSYDASVSSNNASGHVYAVKNQFGTINVRLAQVVSIYVPAAKSLVGPPAPLTPPVPDHFVCYNARPTSSFSHSNGVTVQDQFVNISIDLDGIAQFCTPANVNGGEPGAQNNPTQELCYSTALPNGFHFVPPPHVFITDEFQSGEIFPDGHIPMFCVPSTAVKVS